VANRDQPVDDRHGDEASAPVLELERAAADAVEPWLVRTVIATARRAFGEVPADLDAAAREMAARAAPVVLADLHDLLHTDVDEQRSNPLSVLRSAVRFPTEVLRSAGIPPVERDDFERQAFPADVYGLAPATWRDVDESLHDPGIVWGAWKAATVLRRRREQGLR